MYVDQSVFQSIISNGSHVFFTYISTLDTYELRYMNAAALEMFGVQEGDYYGRKCYEVLQGLKAPCDFCTNNRLEKGKNYKWYHYNAVSKKRFAINDTLIDTDEGCMRMEIAIDLSDELLQFNSLEDSLAMDQAIISCAQTIFDHDDVDSSIQKLLQTICIFHNAKRSYILQIDEEKDILVNTYEFCVPGVSAEIEHLQAIPLHAIDRWLDILKQNPSICISSVNCELDQSSIEAEILSAQGIESLLVAPLYQDGKVIGFLGVDDPVYQIQNDRMMKTVGAFIVNDLQKRSQAQMLERTVQKLESKLETENLLTQCASMLLNDEDTNVSIEKLLKLINEYFDADRSYLYEVNTDLKRLGRNYEYHRNGSREVSQIPTIVSLKNAKQWFNGRGLNEHSYLYAREIDIQKDTEGYKMLQQLNVEKIIIVPYEKNDQIIGFLGIDEPRLHLENMAFLKTISAFIVNTSAKRDMLAKLQYLSFTDQLTGVHNRNGQMLSIDQLKRTCPSHMGVVFADLNGLKNINDDIGHEAGDFFLKCSARQLAQFFSDPIYRIGGDEFVCFVHDMDQDTFHDTIHALRHGTHSTHYINSAYGAAWSDKAIAIEELIKQADQDMYEEKIRCKSINAMRRKNNMTIDQERIDFLKIDFPDLAL